METTDNLKDIINRQKELLAQLEAEYKDNLNRDLAKENRELKTKLEKAHEEFVKTKTNETMFAEENAKLKQALYEQIYNEKIKIINNTSKKLDIYFHSNIGGELNKPTS